MGYDPKKTVWLNPNIEYLFNDEIIEYDIKDAGFNIIKQFKLLPPEKIRELERIDKGLARHMTIGNMQRDDKVFSQALSDKFAEVRDIFIRFNKLTDDDILAVRKDAIFTIGHCDRLKFGQVQFAPKNTYTSYVRFPEVQNIEIYYSDKGTDVKGMSDSSVNRHRLYMMEFINNVIRMLETKNSRVKRYLMDFVMNYKAGELNEVYYLEFNNKSVSPDALFNYRNVIIPLVQIAMREIGSYEG